MMSLELGVTVLLSDGKEVGRIVGVVIDPVSRTVTDIIVRQWFLFSEDKVIPVDLIETKTEDSIKLSKKASDLEDLSDFDTTHFILLDENEMQRMPYEGIPALYYTYPVDVSIMLQPSDPGSKSSYLTETERNVLERSTSLEEKARVIDVEGNHVGNVERVLTNNKLEHVSHLLVTNGIFLKKKKLIPVQWVSNISEEKIQLAVGSPILKRLHHYK